MQPHRPAYDPYADPRPSEQRKPEMRDTLVGASSDARLARMQQASGLPQGHMEPHLGSHANPHRFRPNSPPLRHAQRHDYAPHPPPSVRMPVDSARLDAPHNYAADRHYDDYHPRSSTQRTRTHAHYPEQQQQQQQRSPNYPASSLHAAPPAYDPLSDARYRPQPYNDHSYLRENHANNFHDQPHPHHASNAYREGRRDDMQRSPAHQMRPSLPSPRDLDAPAHHRISPVNDFAHRSVHPFDAAHRPAYASAPANRDGRHVSEMHHDTTAASRPSTTSSSHAARSTPASRKRKKQFKYMLEREGNDAAKPNGSAENDDRLDPDHSDNSMAIPATDGASQRKESRKKVKKACVFCKRSHMPCEEARPCRRCVKRGISHLCRDAEPVGSAGAASNSTTTKGSKFGEARSNARARRSKQDGPTDQHVGETESESDLESLASSAASSLPHRRGTGSDISAAALVVHARRYDMNVIPGAAMRDPDHRPAMPVSMLITPASAELARRSDRRPSGVSQREQEDAWNRSMDAHMQHRMKQMIEAGPAGGDLNDIFGEMPTSLLMTPAMANLPDGQSILRPASTEPHSSPDRLHRASACKRSSSESLPPATDCEVDEAGFKLPPRPKHLLQEEMATTSELRGGPPTYSYTYGYAKLARWMHTRYSRESCERVDRSLSVIRPKLMALSRSLPEEELIGVEESFYQLLDFYQNHVLETIPVPMIVTRRTGEIYAANSHACNLLQLPASIFEGGQICHYQLVRESDCVKMWGKYAAEAEGKLDTPPNQEAMLEVDRSLLLFDKPGFNPRTGELLGDGRCEDGSPVVVRKRIIVTFEAKISKHGLPFMVTGCMTPIPDEEEANSHEGF